MRPTSILLFATLVFGLRAMAAVHEVGIIPGPGGCPSGSERITISMDDEDGPHSADAHSGWIGATYQDINTTFEFCRVDGDFFTDVTAGPFAVLQLSDKCPKGGQSYGRLFENERDDFFGNNNHYSTSQNKGLFPNWQDDHFTYQEFCYFKNPLQNGLLPGQWFPDFGIEYGVFASPSDLHDAPAYGECSPTTRTAAFFNRMRTTCIRCSPRPCRTSFWPMATTPKCTSPRSVRSASHRPR